MFVLPPAIVESAPLSPAQRAADFTQLWELVRDRHPYLGELDWERAKVLHFPKIQEAKDDAAFQLALEGLLDELGDAHSHLRVSSPRAWRYPPFDMAAGWRGGEVLLRAVFPNSRAWRSGLRPGMRVLELEGRPIREAFLARLPKCLKPERRSIYEAGQELDSDLATWALNSALAGRNGVDRHLKVQDAAGKILEFEPPSPPPLQRPEDAFSYRRLPGNLGYVRIPGFGEESTIKAFDLALDALKDTAGLILDVRDNGGGDTAVTRPMMGRFIHEKTQFAWMNRRKGEGMSERWAEVVKPRGPWTYDKPVVVLVDAWSQSVAEGFAMGMAGLKRATVVGTPMARLGAGTFSSSLKHSRWPVQISAEPVFQLDGRPRNAFLPNVLVNLSSPENLAKEDPIQDAALALLRPAQAQP